MRHIRNGSTILALITAVAIAASAAPVTAQMMTPSARPISIGLGGGVSVPVDNPRNVDFKSGFVGQGFIRVNLPGLPISPRVDFTYSRFDFKDAQFTPPGATVPTTVSGYNNIMAGMLNLTVGLGLGPIRPYIVGGVGAFSIEPKIESGSNTGPGAKVNFGVNGGAGLNIRLKGFSAYMEGRVDNVYNSETGAINPKTIRVVPVTFGIVF